MHVVTEENDNTLENYFVQLVFAKNAIVEEMASILALVRQDVSGRDIRWLSEDEKLLLGRMLVGAGYDGNADALKKYLEREFANKTDTIRDISDADRGFATNLVIRIIENVINVHDVQAINFIMHDKKEDSELLLLNSLKNALGEFRDAYVRVVGAYEGFFERTVDTDRSQQFAEISEKFVIETAAIVEKYSHDAEIENNIERFRKEQQRLRSF